MTTQSLAPRLEEINALTNIISEVDKLGARRGADVLLEILYSEGVEYIFGNPGTTELPLMDALLRAPQLNYILALQEATAVAMADGYAQAARRPAFLNLHTAGGLGHGMGSLLNANVSQTPLVVTAGQQDSRHTVTDPLLFGELVRIAEPAVKWAREVTAADQLPILVRRAFHDANAAPRGPVFLSLPMDVHGRHCRPITDRSKRGGGIPAFARSMPRGSDPWPTRHHRRRRDLRKRRSAGDRCACGSAGGASVWIVLAFAHSLPNISPALGWKPPDLGTANRRNPIRIQRSVCLGRKVSDHPPLH